MSFVGAGAEDWPEFDLIAIETNHRSRVRRLVAEQLTTLSDMAGGQVEMRSLPDDRLGLFLPNRTAPDQHTGEGAGTEPAGSNEISSSTAAPRETVLDQGRTSELLWATVSVRLDGRLVLTKRHRSDLL